MHSVMPAIKLDNYNRVASSEMDEFERINSPLASNPALQTAEKETDQALVALSGDPSKEVNKVVQNTGTDGGATGGDAEIPDVPLINGRNKLDAETIEAAANGHGEKSPPDGAADAAYASNAATTSHESSGTSLKNTSDHSLSLPHKSSSSHNRDSAQQHGNFLAPKRPQRFQPPKRSTSNCSVGSTTSTRNSSDAFKQLRKKQI